MPRLAAIILAFGFTSAATYAALAATDHQPSAVDASPRVQAGASPTRDAGAGADGAPTTLPPLADGGVPGDGRMEPRSAARGVP